jgi:hypothetical protein
LRGREKTPVPKGPEGARQEIQGFRAAGASKEEAVQLVMQLGYDEATAREVADEEY